MPCSRSLRSCCSPPPPPVLETCEECSGTVWFVDAGQTQNTPVGDDGWDTAFPDLQAALAAAQDGDCIWVAAGTYRPGTTRGSTFEITKSISLYGGFSGSETCFAERGSNFSGTRLRGDIGTTAATDNCYRIITIPQPVYPNPSPTVLIDGFNIRDAYNDSANPQGGGIYAYSAAHLTLENCVIRDNVAVDGAGLYAKYASLDVALSRFIGNTGDSGSEGGAIRLETPGDECRIYNTEFKANSASRGGALYVQDLGPSFFVRTANCLFHENVASQGGAAYLVRKDPAGAGVPYSARVEFWNCTLSDNTATTGSAVVAEEDSTGIQPAAVCEMLNCVVWGNSGSTPIAAYDSSSGQWGASQVSFSLVEPAGSFWTCGTVCSTSGQPGNCTNFACDPQFVGTTYRLATTSPAIGQGFYNQSTNYPDYFDFDQDDDLTEIVPWDLDGRPRVQTPSTISLGCYEPN